jgi:PAS domain-containing protein
VADSLQTATKRSGQDELSADPADDRCAELEMIYRTAPVGLALLDRDLRFIRINDRLAAINGRPASEHIGRRLRDAIGPDYAFTVGLSHAFGLDWLMPGRVRRAPRSS